MRAIITDLKDCLKDIIPAFTAIGIFIAAALIVAPWFLKAWIIWLDWVMAL